MGAEGAQAGEFAAGRRPPVDRLGHDERRAGVLEVADHAAAVEAAV
jgi:hypothetical protein